MAILSKLLLFVTGLFLALAYTTGAAQQRQDYSDTQSSGSAARSGQRTDAPLVFPSDQRFVREAIQNGIAEIEMGRLAASRAESEAVRRLGTRAAEDRTALNRQLHQLADAKGIEYQTSASRDVRRRLAVLERGSGARFDRELMAAMVKNHEAGLALFEKAASGARDPDIRAFAQKNTALIRDYLTLAQQAMGGASVGPGSERTGVRPGQPE